MINNVNHITLAVTDIDRSFIFYSDMLGLKPIVKWNRGAYFLINDFWFCLNVDLNSKPDSGYTHYAFNVSENDFLVLAQKIITSGVKIFQDNASQGNSLYFLDPDGHKLEIHAGSWKERVEAKKNDLGNWKDVKWFI